MNHNEQFPDKSRRQQTSSQINPHDVSEKRTYHEEISQDLGLDNPGARLSPSERLSENRNAEGRTNSTIGWIGVLLSIISLFFAPVLFGGAGIIFGFMSRRRDADFLGNTAIIIGIISIVLSLFFTPVG